MKAELAKDLSAENIWVKEPSAESAWVKESSAKVPCLNAPWAKKPPTRAPLLKATLAAFSDPPSDPEAFGSEIKVLTGLLEEHGCRASGDLLPSRCTEEDCLYSPILAAGRFNRDENLRNADFVFDVSGGNLCNLALPAIDFQKLGASSAVWFGYSDLTAMLNAILARAGKASILYQTLNLIRGADGNRVREFFGFLSSSDPENRLVSPRGTFLCGDVMAGELVGGNIRCFLKLAGTGYMPSCRGRILLLEQLHGSVPLLLSMLAQLDQLGILKEISGLVLGSFTELESRGVDIFHHVARFAPRDLPVFKTGEIGHGVNARAAVIGGRYLVKGDMAAFAGWPG